MKKLGRFLTLHARVLYYSICILLGIWIGILLLWDKISLPLAFGLVIFISIIPFFIINFTVARFYNNPLVEKLNKECDPYPLLEEMEFLYSKAKKGLPYLNVAINYSAALANAGQFEKALAVLQNTDISKIPNINPVYMLYYYNNLCAAYDKNGMTAQASDTYSKALAAYSVIKNEKLKARFQNSISLNMAEESLRNGDFEGARSAVSDLTPSNPHEKITLSMLRAKICIGLRETEKAKEHLRFVIENGNKLYDVTEAKELLRSLT